MLAAIANPDPLDLSDKSPTLNILIKKGGRDLLASEFKLWRQHWWSQVQGELDADSEASPPSLALSYLCICQHICFSFSGQLTHTLEIRPQATQVHIPPATRKRLKERKKKKNHCSSPSVPVRKGKDPDWPMWVVFLGMGRSCDRGRVNEPGSGLVTCPSLWPRRETGRHPPVLTEVEIKPLPKDKDCCYQKAGRRRAWANSTHPLCYFRGEKQVMQGHIIIFYVRYLQQQTSLPPQAWKSEDKDLTPDGIFYLSPNNFWEVEQVHHPS